MPANRGKRRWVVIAFLILLSSTILVFWMGYIMGEMHYKKQISEAIAKGDTLESFKACHEWAKSSAKAMHDPLYYIAIAASFNKQGNQEMVKWNLAKAAELLKE